MKHWIGIGAVALGFFMIAVWPGPDYWYIGATLFLGFMIWLGTQTLGPKRK